MIKQFEIYVCNYLSLKANPKKFSDGSTKSLATTNDASNIAKLLTCLNNINVIKNKNAFPSEFCIKISTLLKCELEDLRLLNFPDCQNEAFKMETKPESIAVKNKMTHFLLGMNNLSMENLDFFPKLIASNRLEDMIEKTKEAIMANVINFLRRRNKFYENWGFLKIDLIKFNKNGI